MRAVSAFVFAFAIVNSLDSTFGVKSEIEKFPKSKELKNKLIKTLSKSFYLTLDEPESFSGIVDTMKRVTVKPGDVIIKQGDKVDDSRSLYIIESGTYVATRNTSQYVDVPIKTYNDHGLFGEFAFFENRPRIATVTAKSAGVLYSLDHNTFDKLRVMKKFRRDHHYFPPMIHC
ncbi:hypothetical protein GE061_004304 [Apolygus lucorum]|uniref:Cyclic nucleotide-binding domain-containing protein n=1 Tax=Apolygus lucorum TaxID=248454 RepID=A0A8S9X0K9_APOLU|nr:hypothetical protein GE061_004304 [Apolygus lucorum]